MYNVNSGWQYCILTYRYCRAYMRITELNAYNMQLQLHTYIHCT